MLSPVTALALIETQMGYCMDQSQLAVVASGEDDELICVACSDVAAGDPVATAEGMQESILRDAIEVRRLVFVSLNAEAVSALKAEGFRCLLGEVDEAERAYLAVRTVSLSRDHYVTGWAFRSSLVVPELHWPERSIRERMQAVSVVMEQMLLDSDESAKLLVAALTGPIWLRDAVMIHLARSLAEHEGVMRRAAQGTDEDAALAPLMFAGLMGGRELIARALDSRLPEDCQVSLARLVRTCLRMGCARTLAPEILSEQMMSDVLASGLSAEEVKA